MNLMNGHHLILGEVEDFITGQRLKDTHDERYRQKIARLLVVHKGYRKADIEPRRKLVVQADDRKAIVKIDFVINLSNRACMIIKFGPGSIVTRRRPVLAASRILVPYQIPVAVVTNGTAVLGLGNLGALASKPGSVRRPWLPRSITEGTMPVPKSMAQYRLTVTRAVSGWRSTTRS